MAATEHASMATAGARNCRTMPATGAGRDTRPRRHHDALLQKGRMDMLIRWHPAA